MEIEILEAARDVVKKSVVAQRVRAVTGQVPLSGGGDSKLLPVSRTLGSTPN
jgi:hypothetical protein